MIDLAALSEKQTKQVFQAALRELLDRSQPHAIFRPITAAILSMYYVDGWTYSMIAAELGWKGLNGYTRVSEQVVQKTKALKRKYPNLRFPKRDCEKT